MTASPLELIECLGSDDFNERARALAALVGLGRGAAPALREALDGEDDTVRAGAARALAEIGDPDSSDRLAAATADPNAEVRAYAALGLARAGDPRAIEALVGTIDELPDPLHYPYTGSVYALIELGPPALTAVAPLLSADAPTTRQRAFVVVRSVVSALEAGNDWAALWDELGRYDPDGDAAEREAAAEEWAAWIREQA
jgi:HEAT repeat protein